MKYRAKRPIVEAVQWTGDNFSEVKAFAPSARLCGHTVVVDSFFCVEYVHVGDYIMPHPLAGHRAITPGVFVRDYEEVP